MKSSSAGQIILALALGMLVARQVAVRDAGPRSRRAGRRLTLTWENFHGYGRRSRAFFLTRRGPLGYGAAGFKKFLTIVRGLPPRSHVALKWHGRPMHRPHWSAFSGPAVPRPPYTRREYRALLALALARKISVTRIGFWRPRKPHVFTWFPRASIPRSIRSEKACLAWVAGAWTGICSRISSRRTSRFRPARVRLPRRIIALAYVASARKTAQRHWLLDAVETPQFTATRFGHALREALFLNLIAAPQLTRLLAANPPKTIGFCGAEAVLCDYYAHNVRLVGEHNALGVFLRSLKTARRRKARRALAVILSRSLRAYGAPVVHADDPVAVRSEPVFNFCNRFYKKNRSRLAFNRDYFDNFIRARTGRFRRHFAQCPLETVWRRDRRGKKRP